MTGCTRRQADGALYAIVARAGPSSRNHGQPAEPAVYGGALPPVDEQVQPEIHTVGSQSASWPSNLTENPYESLKIGPKLGPTLWILSLRSLSRSAPCVVQKVMNIELTLLCGILGAITV